MEKEEQKVEKYYLNEANRMIDMFFDGKLFREDITRGQMDVMADVLGFYLQSYAKSSERTAKFLYEMKKIKS